MPKKKILILFCILLVVITVITLIKLPRRINPRQVEKMVLSSYCTPVYELSPEESAEFIKLYHSAKYEGSSIGYGTTPYYSITVHFRDGSCLRVNEYGGHNFSVSRIVGNTSVNRYFVSSAKLDTFLAELAEQYC